MTYCRSRSLSLSLSTSSLPSLISLCTFGQILFPLSYCKAPSACFPHTWAEAANKQNSLRDARMNTSVSLSRGKYDPFLGDALLGHWPVSQTIDSRDGLEFLLTCWLSSRASDCRCHRRGAAAETPSGRARTWPYNGEESVLVKRHLGYIPVTLRTLFLFQIIMSQKNLLYFPMWAKQLLGICLLACVAWETIQSWEARIQFPGQTYSLKTSVILGRCNCKNGPSQVTHKALHATLCVSCGAYVMRTVCGHSCDMLFLIDCGKIGEKTEWATQQH